jgi:hypothetical protein
MKYAALRIEAVRLQLEGVIADSHCPVIGGDVKYNEYIDEELSNDGNEYISIL